MHLKDVEHRVQLEAEAMGLERAFPSVGPVNVKGIEINSYAAELARVSVWMARFSGCGATGLPRIVIRFLNHSTPSNAATRY